MTPPRMTDAIAAASGRLRVVPLAGRTVESLLDLPPMQDPGTITLMGLLSHCLPAAYQSDQESYALLCCAIRARHREPVSLERFKRLHPGLGWKSRPLTCAASMTLSVPLWSGRARLMQA